MRLDLLLFNAYRLAEDPHEQQLMRPFAPLGMQYLVAYLRREGFPETDWFDSTFTASEADFDAQVADTDPRVVGHYGHTVTRPLALLRIARCAAEDRRVIAGGPDPAQYPEEYLDAGVEVIVVGEGELTLHALMSHLRENAWRFRREYLKNIPGLLFRDEDGALFRTAARPLIRPLDSLPWPVRERRDLDAYLTAWRERHGETALSMTTSRGCPYHCAWCSKAAYGDTFRRRSVGDVVSEVVALRRTFDPDQLWFVDDLFTINRRWVLDFAAEMRRRHAVLPYYLIGRPEMIDDELAGALRSSGCYRIYMSAESGSQRVLDAMHKDNRVEHVYRAAALLRKHGIELGVFTMLGYVGEAQADVEATLRMLRELRPDVTLLSVAHPMKGTAFYADVAHLIETRPGWEAENGGRLPFRMRYPPEFYAAVQRGFWSEVRLRDAVRERRFDAQVARDLLALPLHLARAGWLGRAPPPEGWEDDGSLTPRS